MSEGARSILWRSGLPIDAGPQAIIYYCLAHNLLPDGREDGLSPHCRKHGHESTAPNIPFGALVTVKKSNPELKTQEKLEDKIVDCLFAGWHRKAGGETTKRALFWPLRAILDDPTRLPRLIDTVDYEVPSYEDVKFPMAEFRDKALESKGVEFFRQQCDNLFSVEGGGSYGPTSRSENLIINLLENQPSASSTPPYRNPGRETSVGGKAKSGAS